GIVGSHPSDASRGRAAPSDRGHILPARLERVAKILVRRGARVAVTPRAIPSQRGPRPGSPPRPRRALARDATPARPDRAAGHGRLADRGRGRPPGAPPMIERAYEYRLKAGRLEVRATLMAAGALLLTYLALTNDRGLILFIIPLERGAATVAYWVF